MLLKGTKLITYGAVLVSFGVIMVLISTYTPFGKRVLFLTSGLPVLFAVRLAGLRAGAAVYAATALLLLFSVQPLKGVGYLLVAGGVPILISIPALNILAEVLLTFLFSMAYLGIGSAFLGLSIESLLKGIGYWIPWLDARVSAALAVLALSFLYPFLLHILSRELESHWLFREIFKP